MDRLVVKVSLDRRVSLGRQDVLVIRDPLAAQQIQVLLVLLVLPVILEPRALRV